MTAINGDKVYADAKALCYGAAMEAAPPFERKRLEDFTVVERRMIDRIAEWMGSRDCEIAQLRGFIAEFVRYWTTDRSPNGCGMCGGLPHSSTCFVGRASDLIHLESCPASERSA